MSSGVAAGRTQARLPKRNRFNRTGRGPMPCAGAGSRNPGRRYSAASARNAGEKCGATSRAKRAMTSRCRSLGMPGVAAETSA